MEGKYWKRKLAAVTAEYKKWRMFFRNQTLGHLKDATEIVCWETKVQNHFVTRNLFSFSGKRYRFVYVEFGKLGKHAHDGGRGLHGVNERHAIFDHHKSTVCFS